MLMSDREIVHSYRTAKYKDKQITILAEMNCMSSAPEALGNAKFEIVKILTKAGVIEKTAAVRKIVLHGTKEQRRKSFLKFSDFISDCLTEMDKLPPEEREQYRKDIEEVREFLCESVVEGY